MFLPHRLVHRMLEKEDVIGLASLPKPSHVENLQLPRRSSSYQKITGPKEMVAFFDSKNPDELLGHPVLGPILSSQDSSIFVKGENGEKSLRMNPCPIDVQGKMGSVEVVYLVTAGKLTGNPEDDDFEVPSSWRNAVASMRPILDKDEKEGRKDLAILLGNDLVRDENSSHAMRAVARALGNMRYNETLYKSDPADVAKDGVVPERKAEAQETPETVTKGIRNAVDNVLLVTDVQVESQSNEMVQAFREGDTVSRIQTLCRFLAECPHNLLDCETFVKVLVKLNDEVRALGANTEIEIYGDPKATDRGIKLTGSLDDLNLNVLKAVHAGSKDGEVGPFMVRIKYRHPKASQKPVDLVVAKCIMQDDGGLCAKGAAAVDMQADMTGGAAAAAMLARIGEEKPVQNVDLVFAIATNGVDGKSYKVNDILTFASGVTVKILNTDAEGRLALADAGGAALILLRKEGKEIGKVTTVATLTGHAIAVGGDHTVVINRNRKTRRHLEDEGRRRGEKIQGLTLAPIDFKVISNEDGGADFNNIAVGIKIGPITARGAQSATACIATGMGLDALKKDYTEIDIAPWLEKYPDAHKDLKTWPWSMGEAIDTIYHHATTPYEREAA